MRSEQAEYLSREDSSDDLLSTGEVAKLLGVSRQHVVNLVDRGDLPSTRVGTHRRIRRADANLLASGTRRSTRDQTRSLLLAHATAGEIVKDPERAIRIGWNNIERVEAGHLRGGARVWTEDWKRLLQGPLVELLSALTSTSPRSRELRQNQPFAGVLSEADRRKVLAASSFRPERRR
jgi:excisionase family DNA binding protein